MAIGTTVKAYSRRPGPYTRPIRVIDGIEHTLTVEDARYMLHFTNDASVKLWLPAGLTEELRYEGKQIGGGSIAFSPVADSGVEVYTSLDEIAATSEVYSAFILDCIAADKYVLKVQDSDPTKLNKGANTEFESLDDTTDVYGLFLCTRTGAVYRSSDIEWDQTLKRFTVKGSQAVWRSYADVTDGNMGIWQLENAVTAFKLFDSLGEFVSTGTTSSGKRVTRVFTNLRMQNGTSYSESEFKSVEFDTVASHLIKAIDIPLNSIVTVDVGNICVQNEDKNYIIGKAQFAFQNNAGVVTDISRSELRYNQQYSSITNAYVTNADTRIDVGVSGTTGNINFVNTTAKVTHIQCEIKFTVTLLPEL